MTLKSAHQGYEYQDLLSVYFILENILNDEESTYNIDTKEYELDKFDDLSISNKNGIFKKQIKYSNNVTNHILEKKDLSTDGSYQLALDKLFNSWNTNPNISDTEIRLCLAWDEPIDELLDILIPVFDNPTFKKHLTKQYKIDVNKLWPVGEDPKKEWKRFKTESASINRNDFVLFCEKLLIETNFPKSSTYIYEADQLEKIVLEQVEKLGIGLFPNNHLRKEEFVLSLLALVKKARSDGSFINTNEIFLKFQIKTDYGSIVQHFPVDYSKNIPLENNINDLITSLLSNKKILLTGEPGSGKSWFVENLITFLNKQDIKSVKHYCYTDIEDPFQTERIKVDVFYGNIISEIIKAYPYLEDKKQFKFASTLSELNILIDNIDEPTVLIIDGLDHIKRIYNYRQHNDIAISELDIINAIKKINCSETLSILVVSQPITELNNFDGFCRQIIPSWSLTDVKELMTKLKLKVSSIGENQLADTLLKKSEGNPLYLTYIIEEFKSSLGENISKLTNLPPYSYNLKNYYDYLLSMLNTRELIPQILSAVNFSLSKSELMDITGLGDIVEESLDIIMPVLKQNVLWGGYIIYHESFRRFIAETIKSKGADIEKVIFSPLINWFETKNFYDYPKAFRYYLQVLCDGGHFEKVVCFITKNFIKNSIYSGQSWEAISNNYKYLLKGAIKSKDISKVILINEIAKILNSNEYLYDECYSLYLETLGCYHGYKRVSEFLSFEGIPTLPLKKGLVACYLIDENKFVAPWDYYINYFKEGEPIKLEDFKYYIRYYLINSDAQEIIKMAEKMVSKDYNEFKNILVKELHKCNNQSFVNELIAKEDIIGNLCLSVQKFKDSSHLDLEVFIDEILSFDNVFEEEAERIVEFFNQIKLQVNNSEILNRIVKKLVGINWFYNWIIYYIKICQLKYSETTDKAKITLAFEYLTYNTEPFHGKPRTCDFYRLEGFIYDSINEGLSLITKTEDWTSILPILNRVSKDTTTSLQRSLGGPITTDKLFKIFSDNVNSNNVSSIIDILTTQFSDVKNYHLHSYLSEYCFYLVKIYAFDKNINKVEEYFKLGVDFMLGYTMRRDLTIEDLTEGIEAIHIIDNDMGQEYIRRMKDLIDSVIEHTDGKDTKQFPVEWFEKFFNIDSASATKYILHELLNTSYDWRYELSLKYLLKKSNGTINPLIEAILSQTFVVEQSESFLSYSLDLASELKNNRIRKMLTASIYNKYVIKPDSKLAYPFLEKLNNSLTETEFSDNLKISFTAESKNTDINNFEIPPKSKNECIVRKQFPDMSVDELSEYIKSNNIRNEDLQSLYYVFKEQTILTPELKEIIQYLVMKNERYHDQPNIDVSVLFKSNSEVEVYFWISRFILQRDDWSKSLSNLIAFKMAYDLNPTLCLEYLFELLPNKLNIGFNRVFSANLINALSSVGYDTEILKEAWSTLYEMIESRLPVTESYEWDVNLQDNLNMNIEEMFICLLFTRFKSYTVQKFHIVLSGIATLLNDEPLKLIKPFKWFFTNKEQFKNSVVLSVLELIHYFNENNPYYAQNIETEIKRIYPSNYFLIDYLIEELFNLPERINIFPLDELVYPISQDEVRFFSYLNNRHEILEKGGIDISNIFGKFRATYKNLYKKELGMYGNRMHDRIVNNIYLSDYLLDLINKDLYYIFNNYYNKDELYKDIKIDIKSMIAQNQSLSIRPKDLKKASEYDEPSSYTKTISKTNDWIRLGHFEYELIKQDHFKLKECKIFGGVTFHGESKPIFPYSDYRLNMNDVWDKNNYDYLLQDTIVFAFIQKQFQLEDFKILWLNPTIFKTLELELSNFIYGLYAFNRNNQPILKYNSWSSDYIATDYSNDINDEIPKLDGAELLIREDYFSKICSMYSFTPSYCTIKTPLK